MVFDVRSAPYPEKRLQLAALAWAEQHMGYRAISDDVEATGDRMDAIGMLGDELLVIETKVHVVEATVSFDPLRSATIEPKISGTLAPLYAGCLKGQPGLIGQHWDRKTPLTICILAHSYSGKGLAALTGMLENRSREWGFNYRVWRWAGEQVDEIAQGFPLVEINPDKLASAEFPEMIARPIRRPAATLSALRVMADDRGVLDAFEAINERAGRYRMRVARRATGMNLCLPGTSQSWCSIFVEDAGQQHGMNCGVFADLYTQSGLPLPGTSAPRVGYMNTNRFIRTVQDVEVLFAPFRRAQSEAAMAS